MADLGFDAIAGDVIAGGGGSAATGNVLSVTLASLTLSATGVLPIAGLLEPVTLQSATLAATGGSGIFGSLTKTLDALTLSAAAGEKFGLVEVTLAGISLDAHGGGAAGALSAPLAALTSSATGSISKEGALTRTLGRLTSLATGTLPKTGSLSATLSGLTLAATDSTQMFFFAWCGAGDLFGSDFLREDEQIFAWEIEHAEGDFPALRLDVRNPKVGLLGAGRQLWGWLSWRNGGTVEPLFHGRLIGIPEDLHDEVVRLLFVARPDDYLAQKTALATDLRVAPYHDPAWLQEGVDDPDTALEARAAAWHIDRLTNAVTVSDMIVGEDGTLTISADDHLYDGMSVSYGDTPLRRVTVTATATWTQEGAGTTDITRSMWEAFRTSGSPFAYPLISSMTSDGLLTSWPEPETSIGAGWSVGADSTIEKADWVGTLINARVWLRPIYSTEDVEDRPGRWTYGPNGLTWMPAVTHEEQVAAGKETWAVLFPVQPLKINLTAAWEASRARTEILSFTLEADVQPLLVDPGDDEEDTIELSSSFIGEAVDSDGAIPIGDLRRNSYFNTDRGAESIEYTIMLARARILARARAVNVKVETPLALATQLTCRQNALVLDGRLPDGQALGKITQYLLSATGDGELKAEVTIGCTVGNGNTVLADAGEPTYVDAGYMDDYQVYTGATLDPGTSDITYQSLDDLDVLDDDDIDLFNMTAARVVSSIVIEDGLNAQREALNIFKEYREGAIHPAAGAKQTGGKIDEPPAVLEKHPTLVTLTLTPISTRSFQTDYAPDVSMLMVPKTIDLEAA